jgi:DNA mismatch repair protein MSH6
MRDVDVFPAPPPVLFSPPASSPTRKRRFAAALEAAFDDGGGAGAAATTRGPPSASSKTRPSWLLHPRDAAGNPRPATPTSPELCDALRLARAHDPATLTISEGDLRSLPNFTRQFWETKRSLMDVVVMCRHGTFYNMFDVDSDVGIDVGLNVSGKPCAFMQKVGCHHDVFDAWARKVLARGWAVARVEETDEKDADRGGIIRREVTEILTPALDRGLLRDDAASCLLALAEAPWPREDDASMSIDAGDGGGGGGGGDADVEIGVAMIDAAVGEIILGSFVDGPSRDVLAALLARVEPREVIVSVTRR